MNTNIQLQIENIYDTISHIIKRLDNHRLEDEVYKAFQLYSTAHMTTVQNVLNLELDKIRDFESVLAVLNTGRLSRNLIGWNKLKQILNTVKQNLLGIFTLAIPR